MAGVVASVLTVSAPLPVGAASTVSHQPPPRSGYFAMRSVGAWSKLPRDKMCAARVHQSTWEPRKDNDTPNHTMPPRRAVHHAFAVRPMSPGGSYTKRWDTWLLPRVDGHFTGTTDEIFQWAACKWGMSDNLLRAIAVRESTWYQYEVYPSGRPVHDYGSGDLFTTASPASTVYCDGLAKHGRDYQTDYGPGLCPQTFSIVGVMSWQAPSWGKMPANQNGTYPFNRMSTAFAVDYLGSQLRGCYEGWEKWLSGSGTGTYSSGQIWGCVGAWYSGEWHDSAANGYIHRVHRALRRRVWLRPGWPTNRPACSPSYGCPQGS
jgi:hypothetical protein